MASTKLSKEFVLFQQEAFLIKNALCSGLTSLRNARVGDKGQFYGAFFNLSVGIERLLKTILILDHFCSSNLKFPDNKTLRKFSHDIEALYTRAFPLCAKYASSRYRPPFPSDKISRHIIACLSEFATGTRYHNLDQLTGLTNSEDPLEYWYAIVVEIFKADVGSYKQQLVRHQFENLGPKLEESGFLMIGSDMSGKQIGVSESILVEGIAREAAPYVAWRVIQLLHAMTALLSAITERCHEAESTESGTCSIPFMHEFFTFIYPDRKTVLRKKRWP